MKHYLLAILLFSVVDAAACPLKNEAELKAYIGEHQIKRLVFFASWCSSCREHLLHPQPGDLFLGIYDSPENLAKVAKHFGVSERCFTDVSYHRSLGVDELPNIRELKH